MVVLVDPLLPHACRPAMVSLVSLEGAGCVKCAPLESCPLTVRCVSTRGVHSRECVLATTSGHTSAVLCGYQRCG